MLGAKKGTYKGQVKGKTALRIYHEILGLEDLHFGLFSEDDPLTMEGLKTAQKNYTDALCEFVPKDVTRVLDAGCGAGSVSLALSQRGYQVEGLSPDRYQQKIYTQRTGLPFHLNWFEKFTPEKPYDLVVMSESSQYIPLDQLFPAITRVCPTGPVVLADFFVTQLDAGELSIRGHKLNEFKTQAEKAGFRLTKERDITDGTARTLDLAKHWIDRYAVPSLRLINENYGSKHPVLFRAARWLLRNRRVEWDKTLQQVDSARFRQAKRYLIMRLERI